MYLVYSPDACGVRVVFLGHGALGIGKSSVCASNRGPLCLLHCFAFFFFLVSERSGRRKPSAERSALCTRMYHVICSSLPCRLLLVEPSVWMARHPLYVASLEFGHLTLKSCRRRCCWCCWCWLIRAVHRRMFVSCRFGLMCLYRFS